MTTDNDIRHGRHCVFLMHVHLVFITKYWRGVFTNQILDDMRGIFAELCKDFEAELVESDGEDDHVHLLVNYPPKVSVSSLVNSPERRFEQDAREEELPEHSAQAMGRCAVLAILREQLWRGADCHHPTVH